jgi:ABC-type lipoprotein export system ATPase subunit
MILRTSNLQYQYPTGPVLSFPDLELHQGESVIILGPSGSGKTTLLSLVAGLLRPLHGDVEIEGQAIPTMPDAVLDRFRGRRLGFVLQQPLFAEALSIRDNLLLANRMAGEPDNRQRALELLNDLGIAHLGTKLPAECSVGEQQRAMVARALMNRPALILCDEPTSALDDESTAKVSELLQINAQRSGAALLIVTHDQRLKADFDGMVVL